jgi:uncharacterized protein (TIGR02444 family)
VSRAGTPEALWPWSLEVYGRPGVEAVLLELQDAQGQCAPFLLWSLWVAASGRPLDAPKAAACAELARAWQDAAVSPLRKLRRDLEAKARSPRVQVRVREGVKALELEAERMLLQMLEEASAAQPGAAGNAEATLLLAMRAWGALPPAALIERLAKLAA